MIRWPPLREGGPRHPCASQRCSGDRYVQCTVYTQCTVYRALRTVHSAQCTVHRGAHRLIRGG
eukprot:394537-Pyramimonas_sp.AAC.1